jgi:ATP-binding cassette, subfamily A (ABC1), member 3
LVPLSTSKPNTERYANIILII